TSHRGKTDNPHRVTKSQVGLSKVPNVDFTASVASNTSHRGKTDNPHRITKSQVGLSKVPNTDFTAAVAAKSNTNHKHLHYIYPPFSMPLDEDPIIVTQKKYWTTVRSYLFYLSPSVETIFLRVRIKYQVDKKPSANGARCRFAVLNQYSKEVLNKTDTYNNYTLEISPNGYGWTYFKLQLRGMDHSPPREACLQGFTSYMTSYR
ncbi:MAG: hypothetical protein GY874_07675, partial [Desulfobacteraceae bacterium]|nr:hypothetical protein [Desulfobacteraceae bacterium]